MDANSARDPNTSELDGSTRARQYRRSCVFTVLGVVTIVGLSCGVSGFLLQRQVNEAVRKSTCQNNLKQIGLALQNYAETWDAYPPAYTTDAEGNRLHSWRTLILPYLTDTPLYRSIDFTKPWDDPVNKELRTAREPSYVCPALLDGNSRTTYLAVVTQDGCIRAEGSLGFAAVTDGLEQTLLVIEVDAEHAVPWMMPVDADEEVILGLGAESKLAHRGGMLALFADGHVELLDAEMPVEQRRALITAAGNDQAVAEGAE